MTALTVEPEAPVVAVATVEAVVAPVVVATNKYEDNTTHQVVD